MFPDRGLTLGRGMRFSSSASWSDPLLPSILLCLVLAPPLGIQ
jgi:hypothetical protein